MSRLWERVVFLISSVKQQLPLIEYSLYIIWLVEFSYRRQFLWFPPNYRSMSVHYRCKDTICQIKNDKQYNTSRKNTKILVTSYIIQGSFIYWFSHICKSTLSYYYSFLLASYTSRFYSNLLVKSLGIRSILQRLLQQQLQVHHS